MAELDNMTVTVKVEMTEEVIEAFKTFDKRLKRIEQCLFGHEYQPELFGKDK